MEPSPPDIPDVRETKQPDLPSPCPGPEHRIPAEPVKKQGRFIKKAAVAGLVLLAAVLVLMPVAAYLVRSQGPEFVRANLEKRLLDDYRVVSRMDGLSLRLFPVPHMAATGVTLEHPAAVFTVDEVHFYAELRQLIRGRIRLTSIRVESPELRVRSLSKVEDLFSKPDPKRKPFCETMKLPPFRLKIVNGRVTFPVDGPLARLKGRIPEGRVTGIDFRVLSRESGLDIEGGLQSPYTGALSSKLALTHDPSGWCFWDLALSSRHLDLGGLRLVLTTLAPENRTVKTLFGRLIRSGRLEDLGFVFKGRHDEWRDIRRMNARARAVRGEITLPGSSFVLRDLQGPLTLTNGLLTGENLSARLEDSTLKNGQLALDLGQQVDHFFLETDIDAALSGLPGILDAYIHSKEVRKVLAQFQDLSGRAQARLTLKDNLTDLKTYVTASDLQVRAYHRTLGRNIALASGELSVTPEDLTWRNVSGQIGPHLVRESTGSLSFGRNRDLSIQSLSGRLDAGDAVKFLTMFPDLRTKIRPHVKTIRGSVELRNVSLKSALAKPSRPNWRVTADSDRLVLDSSHLPSTASVSFRDLKLEPGKITAPTATVTMNHSPFTLEGVLEFPEDGPSSGRLNLKGTVDRSFRSFLIKQGLVPPALFPRLPLDLAPLVLDWEGPEKNVSGTFVRKDPDAGPVRTEMDLTFNRGRAQVRKLSIVKATDRADIHGSVPEKGSHLPVKGKFKGRLADQTLAALLEAGDQIRADLEGDAWIEIPLQGTMPGYLKGPLSVRNALVRKDGGTIRVDHAQFMGKGNRAEVKVEGLARMESGAGPDRNFDQLFFPQINGTLDFLPRKKALLTVASGSVCGVGFSGEIQLPSLDMNLAFASDRQKQTGVQELLACFGVQSALVTGDLSVKGTLSGTPSMIRKGSFTVRATDGVVQKSTVLTKILSLLDLSELFSQNPVKHLLSTGYRYDSMDIEGTITGDNLHITRCAVKGAGINLYATGHVDLEDKALDLLVLASPFKAVDSIFYHIPIAGPLISGKNKSLLSVPLVVEGSFDNPRTRFLPKPVSRVSSGILDVFVSAFKLPFVLTYDLVTSEKTPAKE